MLIVHQRVRGLVLPGEFSWSPETAENPPASLAFSRATTGDVSTTTDGTTTWTQTAKINEIRYAGLRRVENIMSVAQWDAFSSWSVFGAGASASGDTLTFGPSNSGAQMTAGPSPNLEPNAGDAAWFVVELSGDGTVRLDLVGNDGLGQVDKVVSLTATPTVFAIYNDGFSGTAVDRAKVRIQNASGGTATFATIHSSAIVPSQSGAGTTPPPILTPDEVHNANVPAVRYFATDNGNTVDAGGVVTYAAGSAITDGAVLIEDADSLVLNDWLPVSPYTFVVDCTLPGTLLAENRILSLGTPGTNDLGVDGSGILSLVSDDNLSISLAGALTAEDRVKIAARYATNNSALAAQGKTTVTDATVTTNINALGAITLGGGGEMKIHTIQSTAPLDNSGLEASV